MRQLDLGCGATLRPASPDNEMYGVDIHDYGIENIKVADLAIERIPYDSDSFDLVTAHDFMEHIPPMIYTPGWRVETVEEQPVASLAREVKTLKKRSCLIELFNEIYRVLKPGGEFYMVSPYYLSPDAFRDPTHVSFWTEHTAHYFSGDYVGMHDLYNHTSKFELLENKADRLAGRLYIRLRAIKPMEGPYEISSYTGEIVG